MGGTLRRIRVSYGIGLGAIACLVLTAQVVVESAITRQRGDAAIINRSGRQRMLSQQIAKLALALSGVADSEGAAGRELRDLLEGSIAEFRSNHEVLQQSPATTPSSSEVASI